MMYVRDFDCFVRSPSLLAIACIIAYAIYSFIKTWSNYREDTKFGFRHGCGPVPQLPNSWPLGVDWLHRIFRADNEGHLLEFFNKEADNYVPRNMVSQMFLFGPRTYHVMDPVNVEAILSTNFGDYGFGVRHQVFAPLLGNGIFTQEGAAWKHSRELLRNQFIRTQYQNLEGFREHVDNLLACLPESGGVVDLQPLFFSLTLDTTTALLLGQSSYSLRAKHATDLGAAGASSFGRSFDTAQKGLATRFRLGPLHFLYNPSHFRWSCVAVHQFVDKYIHDHISRVKDGASGGADSFIGQLEEETSSDIALRDQLLNILLAGRDTTACCLSWTMRLIVRHPRVMQRLRQEMSSVMGLAEQPTREHIRRMSYLSAVVKESLRLFAPVPVNNRTATKTTILPRGGGPDGKRPILIRRGEVVAFGQYVIARRKNVWGQDAEEFIPERWEGHETGNPFGWAYFPFNGGPRTCLGQEFAAMEVSYTIVRLLQAYPDIGLPVGEKNERVGTEKQRLTLVLSSADGCIVELNSACRE